MVFTRSSLAIAGTLGLLECAAAFSPSLPSARPSAISRASSVCSRPSGNVLGLRMQVNPMDLGDMPLPEGQKPFVAKERTVEEWIAAFKDSRQSFRTMAAKMVAADYNKDGKGDEVIAKLMSLMTVEDVQERRTAVQALGMIGSTVLKDITDLMLTTEDMVVRASCAKAIGAVALKNPDEVDDFPQYCIDAMVKAATEIPDPITKLAVMSGLSQIGNDCERGLDAILEIAKKSDDVALLTQCMNALGSISELNPDWKGKIEEGLNDAKEAKKGIEGYDVLEMMIDTQLAKVTNEEGARGAMQAGFGDASSLEAIKQQMMGAMKKGLITEQRD